MPALADRCRVCGSGGESVVVWMPESRRAVLPSRLGPSRTEVSTGRIFRCRVCQLGFPEHSPDETDLRQLYRHLPGDVYDSEDRGRSRTAVRHLKIVRRYAASGRLLDVGCASGAFLAVAAEAGWQVVGVDPSESLCRAASARLSGRGQVVCGTLEEAAPVLSPSDVLTLWDVLEHVADPVAFLETCRELVRPGGIVVANVPDLDSLPARLFRGRWPLMLPEHLSYFNRRSLRVLGERVELDWLAAGRRLASFSVGYVLFRLGQHRMPGAATIARFTSALWIDRLTIPVPLGELFVVWRR